MKKQLNPILDLLFHTAKGFYDVGYNCAYNVNQDNGITGFQRIAPGAVNMTFAAELFLKGLHLIVSKEQIKGHYLNSLFNKLPEDIQDKIEKRFNFHREQQKQSKELTAYKFVVSRMNGDKKDAIYSDSNSLKQFLSSHDKGFENWRYLHEIGEDGYTYNINFNLLDCFLKAIIDEINTYQIHKRLHLQSVK
jgi:hypothetical protein